MRMSVENEQSDENYQLLGHSDPPVLSISSYILKASPE